MRNREGVIVLGVAWTVGKRKGGQPKEVHDVWTGTQVELEKRIQEHNKCNPPIRQTGADIRF